MTLFHDVRSMQVLFPPHDDAQSRDIRVISVAGAPWMAGEEPRKLRPTWKRHDSRHRENHRARQKQYKTRHQDRVRTYNHRYERTRKLWKSASLGAAGIAGEVAACST